MALKLLLIQNGVRWTELFVDVFFNFIFNSCKPELHYESPVVLHFCLLVSNSL